MKIVLGGPPRSGKSCLRERLKTALRNRAGLYAYVLTLNPDGEGAWFQEAYHADSTLAVRLRAAHKEPWTDEHVPIYAEWVRECTHPLTLLDVGGRPDARNELICAAATHAILLAPDEAGFLPWREFCGKLRLPLLAEIRSDYDAAADSIDAPVAVAGRNPERLRCGSRFDRRRGRGRSPARGRSLPGTGKARWREAGD